MQNEYNNYLNIELKNKQIKNIIKHYYKEMYQINSCKVDIKVDSIKDRLKEIDLFHHDEPFYNVFFRTIITGKIKDNSGKYNTFKEILNEQATKELLADSLSNIFDLQDIKMAYNFYENCNGGIGVKLSHITGRVDKKALIKRICEK